MFLTDLVGAFEDSRVSSEAWNFGDILILGRVSGAVNACRAVVGVSVYILGNARLFMHQSKDTADH